MLLPDDEETPEITKANINVKVQNNSSEPISGAEVELSSGTLGGPYTATTGSAGGCSFKDLNIGDWDYYVEADGYESLDGVFTAKSGANTLEITLIADD